MELTANQKAWVEALRSGDFKQHRGGLCGEDSFCCLGVLAEISGLPYNKTAGTLGSNVGVRDWVGLRNGEGRFGDTSLAEINDAGKTFADIAGLIEEHADELFMSRSAQ